MASLKEIDEANAFAAFSGTPSEVRGRLDQLADERVVALSFNGPAQYATALAETIMNLGPLVTNILHERDKTMRKLLLDAFVPVIPPPRHILAEARMQREARQAVIDAGEWLTAADIARLAELSDTNPSAQPNRWKRDRQIFAIKQGATDYFPAYGLDPSNRYRPVKALAEVLKVFGDSKDGWGAAYWFASQNSLLGGQRPQDLLGQEPQRVIDAAHDEMVGVVHG